MDPPAAPRVPDEPTPEEFERFRTLVNEEMGLALEATGRPLLAGRLVGRIRELGLPSWSAYHARALADRAERVRMVDLLCTHETAFFRQPQQWALLREKIFPAWRAEMAAGRRPKELRVWSAACATGEEPFTIAMALLEAFPKGVRLDVLATDLSTRALEWARNATWPIARAAEIPPALLKAHMLRGEGRLDGTMRAKEHLRDLVAFRRFNLADRFWPALGPFDLVFCRNVLIYFDRESRRRAVQSLLATTAPGGYLLIGHAESIAPTAVKARVIIPTVYAPVEEAPAEG